MKQAGIYNPYWATLGGGEKYTSLVISALLAKNYQVSIFTDQTDLTERVHQRFGVDIQKARIDPLGDELLKTGSMLQKIRFEKTFDLLFWVSDGSVPFMNSRFNLLHFQVPFKKVSGGWKNSLKMTKIHRVICNSKFTKSVIDREYKCQSVVVYPPATMMQKGIKSKTILSVGRFDNLLNAKRQDVLIEAFKKMNLSDWKLTLAGGSLSGSGEISRLEKLIGGDSRIELVVNPTFNEIASLYSKASIYWHAAGYGSDLAKNPEKAEHFGISTVEAMSQGAIPVVFNGGGQVEIVDPGQNGFLWSYPQELIKITYDLTGGKIDLSLLGKNAIKTAGKFSNQNFYDAINQVIS